MTGEGDIIRASTKKNGERDVIKASIEKKKVSSGSKTPKLYQKNNSFVRGLRDGEDTDQFLVWPFCLENQKYKKLHVVALDQPSDIIRMCTHNIIRLQPLSESGENDL